MQVRALLLRMPPLGQLGPGIGGGDEGEEVGSIVEERIERDPELFHDDLSELVLFLCMLAYYVEWHMREAWRELLFADEDPATQAIRDPVAPVQRSAGCLPSDRQGKPMCAARR